jgi:hypothetical protein
MRNRSSNHNIFWIFIGGILLVALIFMFTDPWSNFTGQTGSVVLKNADRVDRIVITGQSDSTQLVREGSQWIINGRDPAGKVAVDNLIFAAQHLSVASIVSFEAMDRTGDGISVSFYDDQKVLLSYDLNSEGEKNLMYIPGSDKYFYVSLPGYEGISLAKLFSPVPGHYHEHQLIGLLPGEIACLDIAIPGKSHFSVSQDPSGDYTCFDEMLQMSVPADSIDDHAIRMLLSYFSDIRYEEIYGILSASELRSRHSGEMIARLNIRSVAGEERTFEVYPFYPEGAREPDMFRALVIFNDNPDVLIVNYIYLDVLMRELGRYLSPR